MIAMFYDSDALPNLLTCNGILAILAGDKRGQRPARVEM